MDETTPPNDTTQRTVFKPTTTSLFKPTTTSLNAKPSDKEVLEYKKKNNNNKKYINLCCYF